MLPLAKAQHYAETIAEKLHSYCDKIEIAGSIRRGRPYCGDIDLVVLPRDIEGLRDRVKLGRKVITDGTQNLIVELADGTQLDIFIARPQTRTLLDINPTNFGSLFLCRTGSSKHNIYLIEHAKTLGLIWSPYQGIYRGHDLIASETEEDIFQALQLTPVPPGKRER
jgi:DNA polymerase (family 10)